ncbi:TIGR02147 family protein [Bdellovibrio bacteriovorus]|uniref:TIGR02147 family protein n=1 Tax=Bdellovibrio bacteriovorus TaxID=959 RepID=UPI0035A63856
MSEKSVSQLLMQIYNKRRTQNPRYSQRAFARDLGLSSGHLSELLSDKRLPNKTTMTQLIRKLGLNGVDVDRFIEAAADSKKRKVQRKLPVVLEPEQFSIVADWEHFALVSLMKTKGFRADEQWIAERLEISRSRVSQILNQLEQAGLIKRSAGKLSSLEGNITTTQDIPSEVIRQSHTQRIGLALKSLKKDPVSIRDISAITMPANPALLPEVKKMITAFRRKVARRLGNTGKCTEVYSLNIQLFPLTHNVETEE